jgi:hypothetical protein
MIPRRGRRPAERGGDLSDRAHEGRGFTLAVAGGIIHRVPLEQIRGDDRLSPVGLDALVPGMDVGAILRHADGSTVKLVRGHSDMAAQLSWLTRGSAFNLFTTT